MEQEFQIPCPDCGDILNSFANVCHHLFNVHGVRVGAQRPQGFICRICGLHFQTYVGWRRHTNNLHLVVLQNPNENEMQVGDEGNDQVDDENLNNEPVDDDILSEGLANDGDNIGDDLNDENSGESSDNMESDDEYSSSDEEYNALETLPNGQKDIVHAAVSMIVNLRGVAAMTRVGVRRAMVASDLVLRVNNESLKDRVQQYLVNSGEIDRPQARALLNQFDKPSPFLGIKSDAGQISGVQKYYSYIKPVTCHLQEHLDLRLGEDGAYGLVPVPGSYQSVSIIEILKLVASKPALMDYVNNLRPSEDGMLRCFTDSDQYRRSEYFRQYPHAFQLCLYYDGVDPCRSHGPKSGLHELGNFLVKILNLPPRINSSLSGIHPVVLANSMDCKGTFENVLHRFVQEVRELEEPGVRAFINGQFVTIRATLVAVKADSKAAHELLGFLGSGARHFCRQCMISRAELHLGQIAFGARRTPALSEQQLQRVAQNEAYSTECGLRYRTVLHDIRHYRAEDNCNFDLMHDGAEGVIMMLIRLCMRQFVCIENLFQVQELNGRIFAFNYGKQNMRDRPTPNFTLDSLQQADRVHKQKSNAAQTLVLFRALPFLLDSIGDGVQEDHEHYQMLLLLLQIYQIASAPVVSRDSIPLLRRLLEVFRRSWYQVFPNVNPINKFHHLMHMSENLLEKGPQQHFSCFREEGKNCPTKRHIVTCNNFINPPKTTMEQQQIYQTKVWGTRSPDVVKAVKYVRREIILVENLPVAPQLRVLGFRNDDGIRCHRAVTAGGFEYRIGEFLLYRKAIPDINELHQFGRIMCIICPEGTDYIWFGVQHWHNGGLVERFNAYTVHQLENAPTHLINIIDLPLHPPISAWHDYSTDNFYLCLKYLVF